MQVCLIGGDLLAVSPLKVMSDAVMRGSSSATLTLLRGPVGVGGGAGVPSCAEADFTPSWVSTVAVAATLPVICSTRRIMSRRDMSPST